MNRFLNSASHLKLFPLVLLLGAASGLAMPSFNLWPILGVSMPVFLMVLMHTQRTFWMGWSFGFGYFLVALHWIAYAFFVNATSDLWMMPFAVGGLCAVAALYWGLAAWATAKMLKHGFPIWLGFAFCLGTAEYLRGILLTGFPWAVPGLAIDGMGGVAQAASVVGMNGMSFLILLWAVSPLVWLQGNRKQAVVILLSLPLLWLWGNWHISQNPTQYVKGVGVRLVQPNISQSDKWRGDNARAIYDQLLQQSRLPSKAGFEVTHIIWPESALPFLLEESDQGKAELRPVLTGGKTLLAGAVRRSVDHSQYFTSILVFDDEAEEIAHYDKSHLVPGGEYLPLAELLEPLGFRKIVNIPESFSAGTGTQLYPIPGAGMANLQICYEAIFPALATTKNGRADWIVNVTNDGWFGGSTGPYQHLAMLRLRAIEQGIPVARAANTGVSAIIDPVGRYIEMTKLNVLDTRDSRLPQNLQPTVYSNLNEVTPLLIGVILFFWGSVQRKR
jgi:apolipoprotein N-acyltransferase